LTPDEEARQAIEQLGCLLARAMPPGWGFGLMCFQVGKGGHMAFSTNAERAGVLEALRELVAMIDSAPDAPTVDDAPDAPHGAAPQ
jgi:hypothetical protein